MRRAQDSLNPQMHADFMVLAHEDEGEHGGHPYWYGSILNIFHTFVIHHGSANEVPQQIDLLWVRWFGRDLLHSAGWKVKQLHCIGFIPADNDGAFGFLNPQNVVHAIHLIPAFKYGHMPDLLPHSIVRHAKENDKDWCMFYVNMYVWRRSESVIAWV